jgi:hypothetical protein
MKMKFVLQDLIRKTGHGTYKDYLPLIFLESLACR